jgi:hypothetical protein
MVVAMVEYDRPGLSAIRGDALFYFANTGSSDAEGGALVMRTALNAGKTIVPPDLRKFQESIKQRQQ